MAAHPVGAYLKSSIGRKQVMGLAGLYLYFFLLIHLAGNIGLLAGAGHFNSYGHLMLHTLREIIYPVELTLTAAFVLHLYLGLKITFENRAARPQGYAVSASKAKRGFYSRFMAISGSWLLVFVLVHVPHFRMGAYSHIDTVVYGGVEMRDLYGATMFWFAKGWFTLFYVISFGFLYTHLAHGVGSSLQSAGLNHPRYNRAIRLASTTYAVVICGGFAALAGWAYFQGGAIQP